MQHERFHYRTLDELKEKAKELGIQLPLAKDTKILMTPYTFGRVTLPNRVWHCADGGGRWTSGRFPFGAYGQPLCERSQRVEAA